MFKICALIIKPQNFQISEEEIKDRFLMLKNVEDTTELVKNKKEDVAIVIAVIEADLKEITNS